MDNFEEKLNKHIDKVLEIQRNKEEKPLSLQELKEVDLSLGMTEEEWEELMKRADENTRLAQSHFGYGNFSEAYSVAEQAVAINPYQEQAILVLAKAALGKYQADNDDDFLEKAQRHANELLKVNPNERQAIELLAKIKNFQKTEVQEKKKTIRYVLLGIAVIIVVVVFFIFKPKSVPKENTALKFQLIEMEENVNAAWAQVENVIARRDRMLPQILELAPSASSSGVDYKTEIESLTKKIEQSNDIYEKVELQVQLQDKIKALLSELNSKENDENIKIILVQIEGSYNRIAVEAKRYNEAVKEYNIMVKKYGDEFPEFKEKVYFQGK